MKDILKGVEYIKVIDNKTGDEIVEFDFKDNIEPIKIKKDFSVCMKFTNTKDN
ncbi:MAG: hypothetical protein HXM14_02995 [Fusobacterium periodonticum]|nr:hypothetical protein [Fusobacterium periodonticum]